MRSPGWLRVRETSGAEEVRNARKTGEPATSRQQRDRRLDPLGRRGRDRETVTPGWQEPGLVEGVLERDELENVGARSSVAPTGLPRGRRQKRTLDGPGQHAWAEA